MVWGPDNHIWVSEREGSRIISVDPKTGEKKLVGSIPDVKVGPQHEGVLGIALDPDLGKNGSKNNVYIAHTYMAVSYTHLRTISAWSWEEISDWDALPSWRGRPFEEEAFPGFNLFPSQGF